MCTHCNWSVWDRPFFFFFFFVALGRKCKIGIIWNVGKSSTLVQWWRYLIILSIPTHGNWFQTNRIPLEHGSDDCPDNTVYSVLPMGKIRHFSGKFDQDLSLYCGSIKPKFQTGLGDWFLWVMISKIYWQFWHSFFKNTYESSYNFYPIEITWRKIEHSVCLKPVSMETWRLHTLWHFTVPA